LKPSWKRRPWRPCHRPSERQAKHRLTAYRPSLKPNSTYPTCPTAIKINCAVWPWYPASRACFSCLFSLSFYIISYQQPTLYRLRRFFFRSGKLKEKL
jgi:hypothetical protein